MVFLILLALALGGVLVFALILVGLLEAPWPVLLGGLLLAFAGLQRLSAQADKVAAESDIVPKAEVRPPVKDQTAGPQPIADELVYRGIRYTHVDTVEAPSNDKSSVLEGTYRGRHWQHAVHNSPSTVDISDEIVYRGCKVKKSKSQTSQVKSS